MTRLNFSEYVDLKDYKAYELVEKQILYNNGAKYGQIVFLAGGAGSGKGFAIQHFMQGADFKIRDVDELKIAFQKLDALGKFTTQDLLDKYGDNISQADKDRIKKELIDIIHIQLKDNQKARILDVELSNKYVPSAKVTSFKSQEETYKFLKGKR